MALNFSREINKRVARNCIRLLQNNIQKLNQLSNALEESTQPHNLTQKAKKFNKFAISSQYRTTPPENPSLWANSFQVERDILERNLQNQYLQPATMPSFKDKSAFDEHLATIPQEEQIKNAHNITTNNSASQRILESFKQKQAKTRPTPLSRLSNPFPEPIKTVFSPFTFSDQEKAEQMFQDQRMVNVNSTKSFISATPNTIRSTKKFYSTKTQPGARQRHPDGVQRFNSSKVFGTSWLDQVRSFSKSKEGSGVCAGKQKSGRVEKLKRCNKMKIKGCPPARPNTICKQKNKEVKCTKVEAPYPSFSESCYIEPKGRRTECDICPWNQKTNPNFKGKLKIPPKFYHTDCTSSSIRTSIMPETVSLGYCDRNSTPLTEFFMQNGDLLKNFRNGKDLSEFGVKKSALSKLLSSDDIFDIVCKKGEKIVPEYPRNCNRIYQDESKNCPKDLTKKKTKKDRLKRKDPKDHKTS